MDRSPEVTPQIAPENERETAIPGTTENTAQSFRDRGTQDAQRLQDEIALSLDDIEDLTPEELTALQNKTTVALEEFQRHVDQIVEEDTNHSLVQQIAELTKTEEGLEEAKNMIVPAINEILYAEGAHDFTKLDSIAEATMLHPDLRQATLETLRSVLGKKYAEKLLSDKNFRKSLQQLEASLQTRLGDEGPKLSGDLSLDHLVVLHETLGPATRELVEAMNLKQHIPDLRYRPEEDVLTISQYKIDEESGEISAEIHCSIEFDDADDEGSLITRVFTKSVEKDAQGNIVSRKNVEHDKFKIAPRHEAKGYAQKITKDCLSAYDKMEVDSITLKANINVGGYAWACYGYGWDEEKMDPQDIRAFVQDLRDSLDRDIITEIRNQNESEGAKSVFAAAQPALERILQQLDQWLSADALNVTPQQIATLGKDGPFLKRDSLKRWHLADSFSESVLEEDSATKGRTRIGKALLLDSKWYGKIDLKANTPQAGKNRALLEKRLDTV